MEAGEKVRCLCGDLIEIPLLQAYDAKVLHCSACGGKLRENAGECEYCGSAITKEECNLGAACPECYARLLKGARYCRECGVEIRPATLQAKRLDSRCPRCEGELVLCTLENEHYTECGGCGGFWLEESSLQEIVESRDESAIGKHVRAAQKETVVEVATHGTK